MLSSILEAVADNYAVLIVIGNNGLKCKLVAIGTTGFEWLPCLLVEGKAVVGSGGRVRHSHKQEILVSCYLKYSGEYCISLPNVKKTP